MSDATKCRIEHSLPGPIWDGTQSHGIGDPDDEWANNLISARAVALSCGALDRSGEAAGHEHDPAEMDLCRRLATEAARVMDNVNVGMGSESGDPFLSYFVVAPLGGPVHRAIDEEWIRRVFGGAIHPDAPIVIEPLEEAGEWWRQVRVDSVDNEDCEEDEEIRAEGEETLERWRAMIRWFRSRDGLRGAAFVMIGETREGAPGCVQLRMALGITASGSLVGLCGQVVHT
jgi:hypothetical protein